MQFVYQTMDERSKIRYMYFLGINRETPHSHYKTKIKFIFLAELMILILGKNVQLLLQTCRLHIFSYKVLRFFFVL